MNEKIRLRFAPSPTGFLHMGSLRTVLLGFLAAKSMKGKFILRIEDTDEKRKVEGAVEGLLDILDWVGIAFDEGPHVGGDYGPYTQSERQEIYDKYKDELLARDGAYPCFCAAERLEEMRKKQQEQKLPPRYDRCCRDLSPEEVGKRIKDGEKFVIRQKMPLEGEVRVHDELRGDIIFQASELEDQVLIKSSGIPTYQFASVIDDYTMEISHVFRAEEWIPSFPKNMLLYKSFGWEAPKFVHLPVVLNKDGKGKLSKRQGDVSVESFRDNGYLVEALINFNALLGWHPKGDNEIMSLDEIISQFSYLDIGASPAVFDIDKLDFFNGYYIRQKGLDELVELCRPYLTENLALTTNDYKKSDDFVRKIIKVEQERLKRLSDIASFSVFFFRDELDYDPEMLIWKQMTKDEVQSNLNFVLDILSGLSDSNWNVESLNEKIVSRIQEKGDKVGPYLWPMRVALTGEKASPSPFEVAEILGKEESLLKIKNAIKLLA